MHHNWHPLLPKRVWSEEEGFSIKKSNICAHIWYAFLPTRIIGWSKEEALATGWKILAGYWLEDFAEGIT